MVYLHTWNSSVVREPTHSIPIYTQKNRLLGQPTQKWVGGSWLLHQMSLLPYQLKIAWITNSGWCGNYVRCLESGLLAQQIRQVEAPNGAYPSARAWLPSNRDCWLTKLRAYQNKTSPTDSDSPSHQSSRRIGWCMGSGCSECLSIAPGAAYFYLIYCLFSIFHGHQWKFVQFLRYLEVSPKRWKVSPRYFPCPRFIIMFIARGLWLATCILSDIIFNSFPPWSSICFILSVHMIVALSRHIFATMAILDCLLGLRRPLSIMLYVNSVTIFPLWRALVKKYVSRWKLITKLALLIQ